MNKKEENVENKENEDVGSDSDIKLMDIVEYKGEKHLVTKVYENKKGRLRCALASAMYHNGEITDYDDESLVYAFLTNVNLVRHY